MPALNEHIVPGTPNQGFQVTLGVIIMIAGLAVALVGIIRSKQ
jgi:hypothetical protein